MVRWMTGSLVWIALLFAACANWAFAMTQSQQASPQQSQQDAKQKKGQEANKSSAPPATSGANPSSTANNSSGGEKPAPLFGGSLNIKSSRQTKDTATLGFNGVDDNGQVQKNFLAATPSGEDTTKTQKLAGYAATAGELDDFIRQGGLNPAAAPAKKPN